MFLKRLLKPLSSTNELSNWFYFYLSCLHRQNRILPTSRSGDCTSAFKKIKFKTHLEYYHHYIMSKPESYTYFFNTALLKKEAESNSESFKLLTDLLNNLEENQSCDDILKDLTTEFSTCDVNEICKRIVVVSKEIATKPKNENVLKVLKHIDTELLKKKMSLDDLLKILTIINGLDFSLISYFQKKGVKKLFKNINTLTPQEVVQLFFVMPAKDFSKCEYKYSVHSYINNNISQFNANELGIIARGITKSNLTFNHNNIANAICSKMIEVVENIHPIPLQSMCKVLLKMMKKLDSRQILHLQEKIIPFVLNFDIQLLLDLSDLGMKAGCMNSSFWETATIKYKENMSNLSPISLYRIEKQIVFHNIEDKELLMLAIREFEKYKNDQKTTAVLVYFLCYLTYCKLYPKSLFDVVLSEKFISEQILSSRSISQVKFFWWILYCNLEIEKPEYLNYKLNVKDRLKIYQLYHSLLWKLKFKDFNKNIFINHIKDTLKNLYGENSIINTVCLPQYESGFVLRFNKYLEAQPIPENFHLDNKSYIKKPLDNNFWIYLYVISGNKPIQNKGTIYVHHETQYRQLKALGYISIAVLKEQYHEHIKQNTQDIFITDLIQKSLKENILKKII